MERDKSSLGKNLRARAVWFAIAALRVLLKACTWTVPLAAMIPFDQEGCYNFVNCTDCLVASCHATLAPNIAEFPDPPERRLAANCQGGRDTGCGSVEPRARLSSAEKRQWAALIRQFD